MKETYKGYKAYDYLGNEYKGLKPSPGNERVEEYLIPLSEDQEKRAEDIVKKNVFIALHDHAELLPDDIPNHMDDYRKLGRRVIAYEALAKSNYDAVFDAICGSMAKNSSNAGWKWDEAIWDLGMRLCDIAHQDFIIKCETVDDIYRAKRDGKFAWIIGMESAAPIENEVDRLDILYGLGLRQIGLTYSSSNMLGAGGQDSYDFGLTEFGRKAVARMNKLGILIDGAHSSSRTILDTVNYSTKPIVLSHIGARSLWDNKRMASDEVMSAVAKAGGLIGVEAAPHTTMVAKNEPHTCYSVIKHFEYICDLVGIDHVTFGTDTLFGDHVALHDASSKFIKSDTKNDIVHVPYVKGMENMTEISKNVIRYLVKEGYSDEDIEKVLGGNILRILKTVWHNVKG